MNRDMPDTDGEQFYEVTMKKRTISLIVLLSAVGGLPFLLGMVWKEYADRARTVMPLTNSPS